MDVFQTNVVCYDEEICVYCVECACDGVSDGKEYALKLIEGTGISMSACREIAVSVIVVRHTAVTVLSM